MYIKTDGIVLREVAYQDSDKLLTVLKMCIRDRNTGSVDLERTVALKKSNSPFFISSRP